MKTVFVSYARSDLRRTPELLADLGEQCAPYEQAGTFRLWTDGQIGVGTDWKQEIDDALNESHGAILLIGPGFLASSFIREEELPTILDRRISDNARVFPVVLRPCAFLDSPLARFQSLNIPTEPFSALDGHQRDLFLAKLAAEVARAMSAPSSPG